VLRVVPRGRPRRGTAAASVIIREVNGQRLPIRVDMTKADFMTSPYYYLNQNDIVYVEPNKTRVNSSSVGPNISVGLSALSLLVTIIALATK
jgi:polysaccharide export outer membrane protein